VTTEWQHCSTAVGYAAGRRTIAVNSSDSHSKYCFKAKVFLCKHTFLVLVTVGLGHGDYKNLYTLIGVNVQKSLKTTALGKRLMAELPLPFLKRMTRSRRMDYIRR